MLDNNGRRTGACETQGHNIQIVLQRFVKTLVVL